MSTGCCILVIMGTDQDGDKEFLAGESGYREFSPIWKEILFFLKGRGLREDPILAIDDGASGFWKALAEVFPQTKWQRCWVHKTPNILNKLPKSIHPKANPLIHEMYMSSTEENAWKTYVYNQ